MRRILLPLWAIFGLLLVSACGPVYDTTYSFSPPSSSGGRACTFQCNQVKIQCQQIEDLSQRQCQQDAQREARDCEYRIRVVENRSPKWYECGADSCSSDYDRCEQSYRSCFESCGGKVVAHTRCVANCDQIPPQERNRDR